MAISLDIIIPSYRLDAQILLKILSLPVPSGVEVKFIIIADNPTIKLPPELSEQKHRKDVEIIVNERNLGFSATRNKGIDVSTGDWILLLDDDIIPDHHLISEYVAEIKKHGESIGFIGTTYMPEPFNPVTKALDIYGITGHFTSATRSGELSWAPTANIVLNKKKLGKRRFNDHLKNGGEDIELLVRNSIENNKKYLTAPKAIVQHPWWNEGKLQIARLFRYGKGFADILKFQHIRKYAYYDFTNTAESLLLTAIAAITNLFLCKLENSLFIFLAGILIFSEWIICFLKTTIVSKKMELTTAFQLFIHKMAYETGALWQIIKSANLAHFAVRVDMGFRKPHPSPFRLNRWKIIKILLILLGSYFSLYFFSNQI